MKLSIEEFNKLKEEYMILRPQWTDHMLGVKSIPKEKLKRFKELSRIVNSVEYMTEEQKNSIHRKNDYGY